MEHRFNKNILKITMMILLFGSLSVTAATREELAKSVPAERDFSFGLPQTPITVTSLETDNTGFGTWQRFIDVKEKYPKEIPIFKPYEIKGKIEIFVSPKGNDFEGDGSIDNPYKTLAKAMAIGSLKTDRTGGIVIYLREGIYDASNEIKIPKGLSGGESNPVIISNYNDEEVIFSGGVSVKFSDFKIADDERAKRLLSEKSQGKVYSVNLKQHGYDKLPQIGDNGEPSLTIDGQTYQMSRWPNSGRTKMFKWEGEGNKYGVIDNGSVRSMHAGLPFTTHTDQPFEFIPADTRPITWENDGNIWMKGQFGCEYIDNLIEKIDTIQNFRDGMISIKSVDAVEHGVRYADNNGYWYINIMEELDMPGEWYIDYNTSTMYVYPLYDLGDVTASLAMNEDPLFRFDEDAHNIVINGIIFESGLSDGINLRGYQNVIQNCTFRDLSKSAVKSDRAEHSGVTCCTSYRTGGFNAGTSIGKNTDLDHSANLKPSGNFVQNCYIIGGNSTLGTTGSIISHNTCLNANSFSGGMKCQIGVIEYNEASGIPVSTHDTGVVYIEGCADAVGNQVRYNFFHESNINRDDKFGIYFDDRSSGNFAYGNILVGNNLFSHGGTDVVYYNNMIIDTWGYGSMRNSDNYYKGGVNHGLYSQYLYGYRADFEKQWFYKSSSLGWASQFPSTREMIQDNTTIRYKTEQGKNNEAGYDEESYEMYAHKRGVEKNNVLFNSVPYEKSTAGERRYFRENNMEYSLDDEFYINGTKQSAQDALFEDYENKNYNLKETSPVYNDIDDFEKLPNINKTGVIVRDDLMKRIFKMPAIHVVYPKNSTDERTFLSDIEFKWTEPTGACYYTLEIAKDPEFTDALVSERLTVPYYLFDKEFEPDTTYYWRVTAYTYSQSIDSTPVVATAKFTTYNYDEAILHTVKDFSEYDEVISQLNVMISSIEEDDGVDKGYGLYQKGTIEQVNQELAKSRQIVDNAGLNSEISTEAKRINKLIMDLLNEKSIPYVRTYKNNFKEEDWSIFAGNSETLFSIKNNEFSFATVKGTSHILDMRPLSPKESVKVMVNFGDMNDWDAFAIKKSINSLSPNGGMILSGQGDGGMYIVVKKDLIELQRCPSIVGQIRITVENNSNIIKPNTWHEIETSCETKDGISHVIFMVDGNVVIDFNAQEDAISPIGYFGFQHNSIMSSGVLMRPGK